MPVSDTHSEPYNTFDGPGFPACKEVAKVYRPSTVDEIVSIVKDASSKGTPVRASGVSRVLSTIYPAISDLHLFRTVICGVRRA